MRNFFIFQAFTTILMCTDIVSSQNEIESLITLANKEQLDDIGKVFLAWNYNETEGIITFELEAETTGYVGLGISPTGSMVGADIFIAGVFPNGTNYFSDYFGTGFEKPKLDDQQDWTLITAQEISGKTFLKFSRLLNTCDDEDYPIGEGTTRLIWAYGASDDIQYHATDRGSHSSNLIGSPMPDLDLEGLKNWQMTLDIKMPSVDTTYWCSFHKGPVLESKHHIVAFDAFLDNLPAKTHTHHFILYNCYLPPGSNETLDQVFGNYTVDTGFNGAHCFGEHAPYVPVQYCPEYLYVWAKGGKMMTFPENVGYPIGDGENTGKQVYHMLEIHFDNPDKLEEVNVHTGVQFYYTDEIREEDAGLLAVGHNTNLMITVPPNTEDFVIVGHCDSECTEWGLPKEGITIFNVLLHAHMSGRKIKLRQYRGDVELPWIDHDDHYDFDFQQNKPIPETILAQRDKLILECTYDSNWNKGNAIVGGISSRDEMCQTYLWYYPRDDVMAACSSQTVFEQHLAHFGIIDYHEVITNGGSVIMIDEPEYLRGPYPQTINNFNWTQEFIKSYQESKRYSTHESLCVKNNYNEDYLVLNSTYPTDVSDYVPENLCKDITDDPSSTTSPTDSSSSSSSNSASMSPATSTEETTAQFIHKM